MEYLAMALIVTASGFGLYLMTEHPGKACAMTALLIIAATIG